MIDQESHAQQRNDAGVANAVRDLARQGLKVRDIASLLHVHPLVVLRALQEPGDSALGHHGGIHG